jgi:hypothetical protein
MFNNAQSLNNEYRQRQEANAERNRLSQSVAVDKAPSQFFPTIANTLKLIIASNLHEESVMTVRDTQTVPNIG